VDIGVQRRVARLDGEDGLLKDVDGFDWLAQFEAEVGEIEGEFAELVVPVGLGCEIERLYGSGN
jgi:hypothetical protein